MGTNKKNKVKIFLNMKKNMKSPNTTSLYEEIIHHFCSLYESGALKKGDKIMSEPELADYFHVSRGTVRRALGRMERDGMLMRWPKRGTFINYLPTSKEEKKIVIGVNFSFSYLTQSVTNMMLKGAVEASAKYNLRLDIAGANPANHETNVNGIIFYYPPEKGTPLYDRVISGNLPAVCISRKINSKVGFIGINDRNDAKRGVLRLFEKGYKKIGFLGNGFAAGLDSGAELRWNGYCDALKEMGLRPCKKHVCFLTHHANFYEHVAGYLKKADVDALFIAVLTPVFPVVYSLNQQRLKIGLDIAVMCFDNLELALMNGPGMMYLKIPAASIGSAAIEYLHQKIVLKHTVPVVNKIFESEIIEIPKINEE